MSDFLEIALGTENFDELIQSYSYYIDKTSFIKQIMDTKKVSFFTRPRRFGKTLTMSMLKNFLEMNYDNPSDISRPQELFKNLAITKDTEFCQKHMGQYPVIALSLKDVNGETFLGAITSLCSKFLKLWRQYENIVLNATNLSARTKNQIVGYSEIFQNITLGKSVLNNEIVLDALKNFISLLSEILSTIFKKNTIIIVDEYDVPLAKARGKYYRNMVDYISGMFSITFKTNDSLEKGFLTGCLRVSRESIFTGFNNTQVYDCTNSIYQELFGFTNNEVKKLLKDYHLSDRFDVFKEWYDGYQIGNAEIYNPYSVLSYVNTLIHDSTTEPVNAWINSSGNDFLNEFINYLPDNELNDFQKLLSGETVKKDLNEALNYGDIDDHPNANDDGTANDSNDYTNMWSMLYVTGYLTKVGPKKGTTFTLRIPNKEVKDCFEQKS